MNRLFAADGRCLDVALDHGMFNEYSFLSGLEDMKRAVETAAGAAPDAVQLTPGQAHLLQSIPGRQKPALVLRVDTANVYKRETRDGFFSEVMGGAVEQALRLDAACLVLNLLYVPGNPEVYRHSIANIARLKPECERYAMPLMLEPLVLVRGRDGGLEGGGDLEQAISLVRQAVELGADVVKCEPAADAAQFHRLVQAASGKPVLVRGGGRQPEEIVLQRTWEYLQQGASGLVYGRNIVQHRSPEAMTRALMALVHDVASAAEALAMLPALAQK